MIVFCCLCSSKFGQTSFECCSILFSLAKSIENVYLMLSEQHYGHTRVLGRFNCSAAAFVKAHIVFVYYFVSCLWPEVASTNSCK